VLPATRHKRIRPPNVKPVRRVVDLPIPEGWEDLVGWLYTKIVYATQTVTHPSSNRAQCRATLLIKTNVLTTTPRRHDVLTITALPVTLLLTCNKIIIRISQSTFWKLHSVPTKPPKWNSLTFLWHYRQVLQLFWQKSAFKLKLKFTKTRTHREIHQLVITAQECS